ncbi:MAG: hypothetical protein KDB11_32265 [Planctomycetales bacterium]|nr:hypothetical protein [Planctomycetales bacterium]
MKMVKWMLIGVFAVFAGCSNSDVAQNSESAANGPTDSKYVAASEPAGAMPVGEAREAVEDEQAVTLVGTIGGSSEPFVDGLAAFTIVDPKVPYCSPDEGCPTPWDYCCTQDQVKENIATVKVVGESGSPVSGDARQLLGVKELSTVVVEGKAKRDDQGNLTIAATKVFVRPSE